MSTALTDALLASDEAATLAIYDRAVRPVVRPADANKFVAVAVESGDFELDPGEVAAVDRRPGVRVWLMRIGPAPAHRLISPGRGEIR